MEISNYPREMNLQTRSKQNRRYCQSMYLFDHHLSQAEFNTYAFGSSNRCSYYPGSKYHTVYSKNDTKKRRPSIPNVNEPSSSSTNGLEKEVKGLKIFKSLSLRLSSQKVSFQEIQNLFWKKSVKNEIHLPLEVNNGITQTKFSIKKLDIDFEKEFTDSYSLNNAYCNQIKNYNQRKDRLEQLNPSESTISLVIKPNYRPIDFTKCSNYYKRVEDVQFKERDQIYKEVNLEKGNGKVLGFSIVGGSDCSLPIFIKSIYANGEAAKNGKLKEGDQIIEVNGTVFTNLSHKDAIKVFKSIKSGEVNILVKRKRFKSKAEQCLLI